MASQLDKAEHVMVMSSVVGSLPSLSEPNNRSVDKSLQRLVQHNLVSYTPILNSWTSTVDYLIGKK